MRNLEGGLGLREGFKHVGVGYVHRYLFLYVNV